MQKYNQNKIKATQVLPYVGTASSIDIGPFIDIYRRNTRRSIQPHTNRGFVWLSAALVYANAMRANRSKHIPLVCVGPFPASNLPHQPRPAQHPSAAKQVYSRYDGLTGVIPDANPRDFSTIGCAWHIR